jgi:hypothetical protein
VRVKRGRKQPLSPAVVLAVGFAVELWVSELRVMGCEADVASGILNACCLPAALMSAAARRLRSGVACKAVRA